MVKGLRQGNNRKLNKNVSIIILMLSIILIAYIGIKVIEKSGIRMTPEEALRANPFINNVTSVLKEINVAGGSVYIVDTSEAFSTAYVEEYGPFWVSRYCFWAEKDEIENDQIKTIAGINYLKSEQEQIQILGIWNEDIEVKTIQITRENGEVYQQLAPINELILFQWQEVDNLNNLSILALDEKNNPIYYYGYPEGTTVLKDWEYKWHRIVKSK